MKTNILSLLAFLLIFQLNAQNQINIEITENTKTPYLLGEINKSGLEGKNYASWFTKNLEDYKPNITVINSIKQDLKDYNILVFMGTWCGDSKREVPRFYKILEASDFPMAQLKIVALSKQANMYKQSPQHEEAGLNIHRVPTFIFYKNGKEINRIVEEPVNSIEEDIASIIKGNYKSIYQIVTAVNNLLKKKGIKGLNRKSKKLIKQYKGKVSSMYELNTYGKILYTTNQLDQAIAVFELNTKLFPDQPRTFMSLANVLGGLKNDKAKAIKVLEEALKIHPKNKDLMKNLEVIKSN